MFGKKDSTCTTSFQGGFSEWCRKPKITFTMVQLIMFFGKQIGKVKLVLPDAVQATYT